MLYTKLALVTCGCYLAISILLDAAVFGMGLLRGGFVILATKGGWLVFFGIAWLTAFLLSWRIVIARLLVGLHRT